MKQSCLVFSLLAATALSLAPAQADERKSFAGPYVGLHAGYSWQGVSGVYDNASTATSLSPLDLNGAVIGGQLGYNAQTSWFLVGIEGDGSALVGSSGVVQVGNQLLRTDLNYLASIRGRLGLVFDDVLLYGTAGIGFTEFKLTDNPTTAAYSSALRLKETGAVYGGGLEWKIAYGISLRGEYLHYDIGARSSIPTSFPSADSGDYVRFNNIDVARAGINVSLSP